MDETAQEAADTGGKSWYQQGEPPFFFYVIILFPFLIF